MIVPEIRPSSDLRNKYNEISQYCYENERPVYITKNGKGDLAVMSIATYEKLTEKFELYKLLEAGLKATENDQVKPFNEVVSKLEKEISLHNGFSS